jgi:hypothetical protein
VWGARGGEVIGQYFFPRHRVTSIRTGEAIVAVGILLVAVLGYRLARRSIDARLAAPWVGLIAYGAGMGLLIAAGRNTILWTGTQARYAAIGALTCLGVVGLALSLADRASRNRVLAAGAALAIAGLCLVVSQTGQREVQALDLSYGNQDRMAVALEQRLVGGSRLWMGLLEQTKDDGIEDRLEASGQSFELKHSIDCGLLGDTVEPRTATTQLPPGVRAEVTRLEAAGDIIPKGMVFDGWVEGAAIDCALLIDLEGNVIGAGGHGSARRGYGGPGATDSPGRVWFSGLAPLRDGGTIYVRLEGHDQLFALPPPPA